MKFSVLISVYKNDQPDHVRTALESISKNQTLKPNQVVIVQDGPVSKELENTITSVADLNKNIEWSIVKLLENKGLAAALNIGLKACKYEYVARMDSDDISIPTRFEKQITFLKSHSDIIVLGGKIAEFNTTVGDLISERRVGLNTHAIIAMAKKRTPFNHMTVVFKSSAIIDAGGYSEDFGKLEDYKLWVDLIDKGYEFANLDEVLVNVRIGNGFIERRSSKNEIEDWDRLQKYLLQSKIINWPQSLINKLYIRAFIYMPKTLKKIAYKFLLRQ